MRFRALLWAVRQGRPVPRPPSARRVAKAIEIDPGVPASFYAAIGLRVIARARVAAGPIGTGRRRGAASRLGRPVRGGSRAYGDLPVVEFGGAAPAASGARLPRHI